MKQKQKTSAKLLGAGLLTAIAASLCCITPLLALISGASGIAATSSRLEPFRPYLIGITLLVLGYAWYQKLKPQNNTVDCACDTPEKPNFWQSQTFLLTMTIFSIAMLLFPYYSTVLFSTAEPQQNTIIHKNHLSTVQFEIEGMTCAACENHISSAVSQLSGVLDVTPSYTGKNAIVKFDTTQISTKEITQAINSTGYLVKHIKSAKQ